MVVDCHHVALCVLSLLDELSHLASMVSPWGCCGGGVGVEGQEVGAGDKSHTPLQLSLMIPCLIGRPYSTRGGQVTFHIYKFGYLHG